jgi:integrase
MARQEQGVQYYFIQNGEKRYRVRWRENGRMRSRSFLRVSGEDGARAFYARVREAQEAKGRLTRVSAVSLTLAQFVAEVWGPKTKRRLSGKTWRRDAAIYNKHILEHLGEQPIAEIDAEALVVWQEDLERNGLGSDSIVKAMSILSRIFKEAARRPRVTGVQGNPVALLERPKQKPRRRPLVWGPVVVERVRYELLITSLRINPEKEVMAMRDAALVSLMAMTGCRPQDALALRWSDIEDRVLITKRLSDDEIVERSKNESDRSAPLLKPLRADLDALRRASGDGPLEQIIHKSGGSNYVETDWRNYRSRHFLPALERVEASWEKWREGLEDPEQVRESVYGLSKTRPYDLGRHTHSALMLASGMSLQRLARIQGHSIRVLDDIYSEQLEEFEDAETAIDPIVEIERARALVWRGRNPSIAKRSSE